MFSINVTFLLLLRTEMIQRITSKQKKFLVKAGVLAYFLFILGSIAGEHSWGHDNRLKWISYFAFSL